jgi:hypothetical protein
MRQRGIDPRPPHSAGSFFRSHTLVTAPAVIIIIRLEGTSQHVASFTVDETHPFNPLWIEITGIVFSLAAVVSTADMTHQYWLQYN